MLIITARNEVGARLCFYTCRWYPSMPCSRSPGGWCLAGFQAHTQGGSCVVWPGGGGSPGPHQRGKLRGLAGRSPCPHLGGLKAHTRGGLQAHTWAGSPGPHLGESPGPHLGGGCIPACTESDPLDGYCYGQYASYWNAFFF